MKKVNMLFLILSFVILVAACSALSMSAVGKEYRFTLVAMNPWNGVEGIAYTIRHFLHIGTGSSMAIGIGLLLVMWWRLYLLLKRTFGR